MPAPDLASHCPAPQTLADFHAGAMPDTDLEAVAAHLSVCPACESALADLERSSAEGGLTDRIRKCLVLPAAAGPAYAPTLAGPEAEPTGWFEGLGGSSGPLLGLLDRDEADAPADDRVVGPYRVLGRLGGGGMGVVFRAEHRELGRPTALKVIRADKLDTAGARPRFRAEAQAVASLEHPNIVRLFDFGEADGTLYFGMELVPGGSLAARLTNGPLPPRAAARLVRDVARAMAHAHRQGVVHRDLKPANVLLAGDTPKVADFGLAKWVASADDTADPGGSSAAAETTAGQVLGTPAYMAVEQAEGRVDDIGPHSDVWALGVILYECVTRRLPFEGPDKSAVLDSVRECEPVRPSARMREISPDLEAICLKCLERDTGCRYSNADALADDLDRWLTDNPVSARTPTRRESAARWVRKHARRAAVAAAVLVVAGVAAAGGAVVPWNKTHAPPPEPWEVSGTLPATASDADAAWGQAAAELARRKTVTLAGENTPPRYYRLVSPAKARLDTAPDAAFTVTAGPHALVELAPSVPGGHYRLRAEIRHQEAFLKGGQVGLYVSHQGAAAGGWSHHNLARVTYSDVVSLQREAEARLGKDLAKKNPLGGDRLRIGIDHLTQRPMPIRQVPGEFAQRDTGRGGKYDPALKADRWRQLEMVVSADGVGIALDGVPAGDMSAQWFTDYNTGLLRTAGELDPADPAARTIPPAFTPTGGVGLILRSGIASFRSVTLEPLD